MAYTVSNGYLQKIYSQDDKNKLKIWFNDVELQDADRYCEKITRVARILPNDGGKRFSLDNFISTSVEVILHDVDVDEIVDQVRISIGTLVGNSYEYVPLGVFNIQDTPVTDKNKVTIKLRDNRVKFDFGYSAQSVIESHGGTATKKQILDDICTKAGVTNTISSFNGDSDQIGIYDSTITGATYVSYLMEQAGLVAVIDRQGRLAAVDLSNLHTWEIPLSIVESYDKGEPYAIERVVYESGIIKYETSQDDTLDTLYLNAANPYISSNSQLTYILNKLSGFEIDSVITKRVLGNPAIDPYDLIEVYNDLDGSNDVVFTTLANTTYTFNGVHRDTFDTQIGIEQRTENVTISGEAAFQKYAKTNIDNINASITLVTQDVVDLQESIELFSVDLSQYNIVVSTDSNKKPFVNETIAVNYYGYYKGQQVTPTVSLTGSQSNVSTSTSSTAISFGVTAGNAIGNKSYTYTATFTYSADGASYSIDKKIVMSLSMQGQQGQQGQPGQAGKGISSVSYYYKTTTEQTEPSASSITGTTIPTMSSTDKYLWRKEVITYTNNTTKTTVSLVSIYGDTGQQGQQGQPGQAGSDGNGINSITYYYKTTTTSTAPAASSITSTTMPTIDATNKYLWQKEVIDYTKATDKVTVLLLAVYGDKGDTGPAGATGTSVSSVTELYYVSNSATAPSKPSSHVTTSSTSTYNAWNLQCPAYTSTYKYFYTCSEILYSNGTYSWSAVSTNNGLGGANSTASTANTNANTAVNAVNNLSIGGRNYFLNSIEEKNWNRSTGNTFLDIDYSSLLKQTESNQFTVSYYAKCDANADGLALDFYFRSNSGDITTIYTADTLTTEYKLYSHTFTFKNSATIDDLVYCRFRLGYGTGTCYIKKYKLEVGNKVTDWSPAPEDTENSISELNTYVDTNITNLQNQIDGAIQFWNGANIPTLNNYPASEWTTEAEKINHQADIYTVIQDVQGELKQGKSYRFDKVNNTWQWIELTDNELSAVQALANSKAKVYVTTPTVPYNIGDLWLNNNKLYRCKTAKTSGQSYSSSDWELATDYTNDAVANQALSAITNLEIGGRNILLKTNQGSTNWNYSKANGASTTEADGIGVHFNVTTASTSWQMVLYKFDSSQVLLLEPYSEYVVSLDYKTNMGTSNFNASVTVQQSNATNQLAGGGTATIINDNDWHKAVFVLTTNGLTNSTSNQFVYIGGFNRIGDLYFKNIKFEKGNKPTDWTPAPEDAVKTLDVEYYLSTSNTQLQGGSWSTTAPAWVDGKYMWSRQKVTYGDGTVITRNETCIAGATGPQGIQGPAGANGTSTYFYVRYSKNSNGNPMTTTPQSDTQYMGVATSTSSTAPTSYSAYTWSKTKGETGSQGIQGPAGPDGTSSYLHIKWSDDGTTFTPAEGSTPAGKSPGRWQGTYVDTNATDSSTFSDYNWVDTGIYVQDQLNALESSIGEVDSRITDTNTTLTNDYYNKDQVNSLTDANANAIAGVVTRVATLEQKDGNLEINVQRIIDQYGASKVTTTTGYRFDESGLNISKTGSEISNLLDNTGMFVKRNTTEMLGADATGVRAENLLVRKYLTIGTNSRLEDYETNRTACFFIGGAS